LRRIFISAAASLALCVCTVFSRADSSTGVENTQPPAAVPADGMRPQDPQSSGERLFQQLHHQTDTLSQPSGHDYLDAKKFMFSKADNTGCAGVPGVLEFYSQICVPGSSQHGQDYKENGDLNLDGVVDSDGMNAEHIWPQGYFDRAFPMRADLHHIFPSFIATNSARSNLPFAVVSKALYSTSSGSKMDSRGFEPAAAVKGDVARALFYFIVRYYDRNIRSGMNYQDFWKVRVPLLMEWNLRDPPDDNERRRNDLINRFQGNRNPFVDDPSLAEKIGVQVFSSH
jgi:hypothetical protein